MSGRETVVTDNFLMREHFCFQASLISAVIRHFIVIIVMMFIIGILAIVGIVIVIVMFTAIVIG